MTSMGVKERSLGRYDVHLVKTSGSSCSSSSEEPAKQASWSGIDASSTASGSDAKAPVAGKQTEHIDEATADSGSVEVIQRPDLTNVEEKTAIVTKEANEEVEAPKSSHVEEWRQKVDVDETQAKIDALLAASAQGNDKAKEKVGDEDPRAARQKLGLTPGKKVYCSHWIRTGECDFIQQGCIYKHEMPDDDSLHAIGIRAVPAWYIAAHPEKARERGIGRGMASGSRSWGARGGPFPASSFTSSRAPLRSQPPAFHSQSTYGFPSKPDATFFGPPAGFSPNFARPSFASHTDQFPGYGHGRIQELPDQAPQQYQYSPRSHSTELQIMRKPAKPKTPGFNTFPFQLPPPTAAASSAPEKHQTKPAPVWEPRPSKLAHRLAYRTDHVPTTTSAENGVAAPRTEHATQQSNQDQANLLAPSSAGGGPHLSNDIKAPRDLSLPNTILHNSTSAAPSTSRPLAINTAYPSLQPIAHPQPTPAAIPARDRKESDSSDLFALVPKTPSPPHRRLFVAPGEERYVTAAEEPKAVREEATVVKEKAGTSPPQDKTPKRHRKDRVASRNERPKNLLYSDSKKRVVSPEKTRKGKQVVKEPRQSIEPLVAL
ncbi:MAG: hypothetical protein LQ346_003444 [Caloplaca aetnensis]|nr:MAG: hypothetical protein LQ346_003444 [Caloplaca aetnensis]